MIWKPGVWFCRIAQPCQQLSSNPSSNQRRYLLPGAVSCSGQELGGYWWLLVFSSPTSLSSTSSSYTCTCTRTHACVRACSCWDAERCPGGWALRVALSLPCQGFLSPGRWCCFDSHALFSVSAGGFSAYEPEPPRDPRLSKGPVYIMALPTESSYCIIVFVHRSDYSLFD